MPTLARKDVLPESSVFYSTFETNNHERFFASGRRKRLVLDSLEDSREKAEGKVLHVCQVVLDDRHIMIAALENEIAPYSNWMQSTHGSLAAAINRQEKREGPLGCRRPTTHPAENDECLLRMMFAIDYLPVKAGLVDSPEHYKYSTYGFFAHGKKQNWTDELVRPLAYQNLGNSPEERQKAYRELGRKYYREGRLDEYMDAMLKRRPVGSEKYRRERSKYLSEVTRRERLKRAAGWAMIESVGFAFQGTALRGHKMLEAFDVLVREIVAPGPDPPRPI